MYQWEGMQIFLLRNLIFIEKLEIWCIDRHGLTNNSLRLLHHQNIDYSKMKPSWLRIDWQQDIKLIFSIVKTEQYQLSKVIASTSMLMVRSFPKIILELVPFWMKVTTQSMALIKWHLYFLNSTHQHSAISYCSRKICLGYLLKTEDPELMTNILFNITEFIKVINELSSNTAAGPDTLQYCWNCARNN